MRSIDLGVRGYGGRPIRTSLVGQPGNADHVAICFPGYEYHATMPALYYPMRYLSLTGAYTLAADFDYDRDEAFIRKTEKEQLDQVVADSAAVVDAVFRHHAFTQVTIVGKSLGTLAMVKQLAEHSRLKDAAAIWLTPFLADPGFVDSMLRCAQRSLVVIGTADRQWHPEHAERIRNAGRRVVVLPGVDHAMEVKNDVVKSVDALKIMMEALISFLSDRIPG